MITEIQRCENDVFVLPVNILTGVARRLLGPHDTLPCVLIHNYVDGVCITYDYPHQHFWTYASGYSAGTMYSYISYNCPCSSYAGQTTPAFVRGDYYCEAGCPAAPSATTYNIIAITCYGMGKIVLLGIAAVRAQPEMPYFYRRLPIATNGTVETIEIRICQGTSFSTAATLVSEIIDYRW